MNVVRKKKKPKRQSRKCRVSVPEQRSIYTRFLPERTLSEKETHARRCRRTKANVRGKREYNTKETLVFYIRAVSTLVFCARPASSSSFIYRQWNLDKTGGRIQPGVEERVAAWSLRLSSLSEITFFLSSCLLNVGTVFKVYIQVASTVFSIQKCVTCAFEFVRANVIVITTWEFHVSHSVANNYSGHI